jgi:hypothetical protein
MEISEKLSKRLQAEKRFIDPETFIVESIYNEKDICFFNAGGVISVPRNFSRFQGECHRLGLPVPQRPAPKTPFYLLSWYNCISKKMTVEQAEGLWLTFDRLELPIDVGACFAH